MNKFIKTVNEDRVPYEFLHSLNGIIGLTERQMQIFAALIKLRLEDLKNKKGELRLDRTENRNELVNKEGISRPNLSKYIDVYLNKGLLVKNANGWLFISKALMPEIIGGKTVQISLILKIN